MSDLLLMGAGALALVSGGGALLWSGALGRREAAEVSAATAEGAELQEARVEQVPAARPRPRAQEVAARPPFWLTFLGGERYLSPGEDPTEPPTCGAGLLSRVREQLLLRGFETGSVIVEDWGAHLAVRDGFGRFRVHLGRGSRSWILYLADPRAPDGYAQPSPEVERLASGVHASLRALSGIHELVWNEDPARAVAPPLPDRRLRPVSRRLRPVERSPDETRSMRGR